MKIYFNQQKKKLLNQKEGNYIVKLSFNLYRTVGFFPTSAITTNPGQREFENFSDDNKIKIMY